MILEKVLPCIVFLLNPVSERNFHKHDFWKSPSVYSFSSESGFERNFHIHKIANHRIMSIVACRPSRSPPELSLSAHFRAVVAMPFVFRFASYSCRAVALCVWAYTCAFASKLSCTCISHPRIARRNAHKIIDSKFYSVYNQFDLKDESCL